MNQPGHLPLPLLRLEGVSAQGLSPAMVAGGRPEPAVLPPLRLSLAAGEAVALLGEAGSGAAQFLKLPTRLGVDLDGARIDGPIWLEGEEVPPSGPALWVARQRAPYIPRLPVAFQGSVLDNLTFAPRVVELAQDGPLLDARVDRVLRRLGVAARWSHLLGRPARQLEPVDLRLLAVARAAMLDPALLLLDDPAAGLGPADTTLLAEALLGLLPQTALLFGGPDTTLARHIATRCLFVAGGAVVEDRPADGFFADPHAPGLRLFLRAAGHVGREAASA